MDAYSLENARRFQWSSITGELNSERVAHLDRYLLGNLFLDAGCAGGAYSKYLRAKGFDVTGVDKMLEFLETIPVDQRHFYKQADITDLPFEDNYFDSTYCFDVLEHVDDLTALKELVRVTKRRLIITVPHENYSLFQKCNLTLLTYQDSTHLRYYNAESLEKLIRTVTNSPFKISGEIRVPIRYLCSELIKGERRFSFSYAVRSLVAFLIKALLLTMKQSDLEFHSSLVAIVDL
ncbi:class I SAM-dependent methyltransferase [Phormidesmis sp. 146-20]